MVKVNIEENDVNLTQRKNLNHLFLIILNNEYDKYIYIDDPKLLNELMKNSLVIIEMIIDILKSILNYKENNNNLENKSFIISKVSVQLSKFFYYFFCIFEKNLVNHQAHDNQNQNDLIDKLLDIYIDSFPNDLFLFTTVFKNLMPYIYKLYRLGCKICPKNCILSRLIHNIFKKIKNNRKKETLFIIYFEYFSTKIYEAGNPSEIFNSILSNKINTNLVLTENANNINILKSIFFNLLDCVSNIEFFKNNIVTFILDIFYLSKNSEYYGNYFYILRCFFKYFKSSLNLTQNPNVNQEERRQKGALSTTFNTEIYPILYGIMKYLKNIKEKTPFLSDIISEIILIMPVRFKFLSEIPHLIFPSLVGLINNSPENTQMNLINLDNWMNIYAKNPECVAPFIQQNMSKIIDLLTNNINTSLNITVCFSSLKWL